MTSEEKFISKYFLFCNQRFSDPDKFHSYPVPDDLRVSINCYAILPEHLALIYLLTEVHYDDEKALTVDVPLRLGLYKAIYPGFVVSHLSFGSQENWNGRVELLNMYKDLADKKFSEYS